MRAAQDAGIDVADVADLHAERTGTKKKTDEQEATEKTNPKQL